MGELTVRRLPGNPVIRPEMLPGGDGGNINGPSLIRAPEWLPDRLGNYYLYFAHHNGTHIRLAYAERLEGPWTVHRPGTLKLSEAPGCRGHIASPDVHVDESARQIRMYFHGPSRSRRGQYSYVALSADGLRFAARDAMLGPFYFRAVRWQAGWLAMAKGGQLYASPDGLSPFGAVTPAPFAMTDPRGNAPGDLRHVALQPRDDGFIVYYTRIGDRPESILRARLEWPAAGGPWRAGPPEHVLGPREVWEGAGLPLTVSRAGPAGGAENAVRDPAIFVEDGRVYLLYSVAGESGIAIAEVHD